MKVRDPRGQTWRVTRRWVPWRRRIRNEVDGDTGGTSFSDLGDDPISLIVGLVLLALFIPVLVLSFLVLLELLLLLLLLPFAVLGRVAFGRHWTIEARRGFTAVWEDQAGSWSASGDRIRDVASRIERGELPPTTLAEGA